MVGKIEVQPPYDRFFTEEGKQALADLMEDPCLAVEHWAPECKLFSRARGRPITLRDGRRIQGPQPVRDARHVMGFPWLKSDMKARVRRSNQMVLKALKRGKEDRRGARCYWCVEHPPRPVLDVGIPPGERYGGVAGDEVLDCFSLLLWGRASEVVRNLE